MTDQVTEICDGRTGGEEVSKQSDPPSTRDFFTLAERVQMSQSAEYLTTAELVKLAESCEPPPPAYPSDPFPWPIPLSPSPTSPSGRGRMDAGEGSCTDGAEHLWRWLNEFCKPLLREMAARLSRNTATDRTNYQQLITAAVQMRTAQRAHTTDRSRGNLRAAREAERHFDRLMEQRQQLQLFE